LLSNIAAAKAKPVCVIAGSDELKGKALVLAQKLRANGTAVEIAHQTNIGKALKFANKIEATTAYIIGEDEAARGVVQVKNLESGQQTEEKL
jgi:histidyl-tRNA synthetase